MYRSEYPRPQFAREDWLCLNGVWEFCFDDENVGHAEKWYEGHQFPLKIQVPFPYQAELSGINDQSFHDHMWYRRTFSIPNKYLDKRVILHVGACDYESEVYINQRLVKHHIGGNSSFSVDITDYLTYTNEEIVIYVYDPSKDEFIPRGKQYWHEENAGIWYTRTSGIWQPIWLEFVDDVHITDFRLTPDIDTGTVKIETNLSKCADVYLEVEIIDQGQTIVESSIKVRNKTLTITFDVFQGSIDATNTHGHGKTWSPEHPYLFDIYFRLIRDEEIIDEVKSYFGMRKIHQQNGLVYLNNKPYYQKLVLDQGYYDGGLLTAPKDECFIEDIKLAKAMGFNGCRRHQMVSDSRFLYHADRLGFLVWGEMANSANFSSEYVNRMVNEWMEVIKRDYNHPCIVTWVPINESWGVPNLKTNPLEQHHVLTMYHLTKSFDNTRLVVCNDGWEMLKTDICAIHNYRHGAPTNIEEHEKFLKSLSTKEEMLSSMPANRPMYISGYEYQGEPILLTEFGGISFDKDQNGWGYTTVNDEETFLKEYERLIQAIRASDCIVGYCYTQLTDVFQEVNGLLTIKRQPKVDMNKIKAINDTVGF
ncbi:MAG: glycoside hydrolase family 2 [Bacilli bacterium]|nr:glycoside hydrolase family 2 [Bacilli bacterium]